MQSIRSFAHSFPHRIERNNVWLCQKRRLSEKLSTPSQNAGEIVFGGVKLQHFVYLVEHISPYMTKVFQPKVVKVTKSEVLIELPYSHLFLGNPAVPALHGGVIATMMDHAGGFVAWGSLDDPKQRVNTADLRIDYLLPAPCELLLFEAKILHKSRKLIRTDLNCYDQVQSALVTDPQTQKTTTNYDNYRNKRLIAAGRGLFNVYTTHHDLSVILEKKLSSIPH
jgi:acyl-coenzyme A thioesterase PaaI-like protein